MVGAILSPSTCIVKPEGMPPTRTYFDDIWLTDARFKQFRVWLDKVPNDCISFQYKLCSKVLKLSSMGLEAIKSHDFNAKQQCLVIAGK